jgi:hypothetical protein
MRLLEEEVEVMVQRVKWETRNLIPLALVVLVVAAVVVAAVVATFELTIGEYVAVTVTVVAVVEVIVAVNKPALLHVEAEAPQALFLADQSELAICI